MTDKLPLAIPLSTLAMAREIEWLGPQDGLWPDENHGVYGRILNVQGELVLDLRVWYEPKKGTGRWTNTALTIPVRYLSEFDRIVNHGKRFVAQEQRRQASTPAPAPSTPVKKKSRTKGRKVA